MSDSARDASASHPSASSRSFERTRDIARKLLRACRAADPEALARVRAQLPRLAAMSEADASAHVRLADVQHALAREAGSANWAALRHAIEASEPLVAQLERFFAALPESELAPMQRVLASHPEVARTSLHAACAACDAAAAEAFLAANSALATATLGPGAWTPLDCLAASPLFALDPAHAAASVAIARRLLDLGASANQSTPEPGSNGAVQLSVLFRAGRIGNAPLVKLLLERGADPNDGESIYHVAERDLREVLELLLAHGAEISEPHRRWGNTPLYFLSGYREGNDAEPAATRGMRWLLEHGADPNVPSGQQRETSLHRVADFGRALTVADLLLDHGADPNLARADGRTSLDLAVRAGHVAMADHLRERGAAGTVRPVDALLGACARADEEAARDVLARHPGLLETLTPGERRAPVHAVERGQVGSARVFAALGFDLAVADSGGATALHHAAWRGNVRLVRELLALGVPIDPREQTYGSSPLAWAAHGSAHCRDADDDYLAVVDALLDAGSAREPSYNHWKEPPEALASDAVAVHLRARGFAPADG